VTSTPTITSTPTATASDGFNIAPNASISVSSFYQNDSNYDGYKAADNVIGVDGSGEWLSNGETNPTIEFDWAGPQTISTVKIYDRSNTGSNVNSGTLIFSNGDSKPVSGIPTDGSAKVITFQPKTVTWVRFVVNGGSGANVGLSEVQILNPVGFVSSPTPTPTSTRTFTPTPTPTNTPTPTPTPTATGVP
jgi:hypothetical protein